MKKKVGDKISMVTSGWSFDHINKKFDKHILRSVPFYEEFIELVSNYLSFL